MRSCLTKRSRGSIDALALRVDPLLEVAMERRHVGIEVVLEPARIAACVLVLLPGLGVAQTGSVLTGAVLTGTVVDASTRAPLQNVVVTATSPALQGEQVVVTDETGTYRVPQLPAGTYALRFE